MDISFKRAFPFVSLRCHLQKLISIHDQTLANVSHLAAYTPLLTLLLYLTFRILIIPLTYFSTHVFLKLYLVYCI